MKIQHPSGIGPTERPAAAAPGARGSAALPAAPGDRVEISDQALRVAALAETARQIPELRVDRLEQLRRDLAEGTYRPDPRSVARALLEFEDALAR